MGIDEQNDGKTLLLGAGHVGNQVPSKMHEGSTDTRGAVIEGLRQPSALQQKLAADLFGVADVERVINPPEGLNGKDVLRINVTNKKEWETVENLRKLAPAFGKIIYDVFKDDGKSADVIGTDEFVRRYFVEGDMAGASDMYVVADEGGKVEGLYLQGDVESAGPLNMKYILLTCVDKNLRGQGMGKDLYRLIFSRQDVDAFVGITHTPSVVSSRVRIGDEFAYDTFFAGSKNGDADLAISDPERNALKLAYAGIDAQTEHYGMGELQEGVPEDYVNYGADGIAPRTMEEVEAIPNQQLRSRFENLVGWQQTNRPGECIYGKIVTLKRFAVDKLKQ